MPDRSNVPEGIIKEREIDRRFANLFKKDIGAPQVVMLSGFAYEDLLSRVHKCCLHQELPVVVVESYEDDEWAYRTPPARLEVSHAIMEEIKAWKGPIGQHDLERILGSTKKKDVRAPREEGRLSPPPSDITK